MAWAVRHVAAERERSGPVSVNAVDFESYRQLLFSIAYRMLGNVADAEDMVQDTYLRVEAFSQEKIDNPRAYLCTVVTRLCLDHLRSARTRREVASGIPLPEPVAGSLLALPPENATLAESLSIAFLTMLQSLAPLERAAFLLHEIFDFDYAEVARIVGKTPVNCRQIVNRARKNMHGGRVRFTISPADVRKIVERFLDAARQGDLTNLLELLAPDVTLYADGGAHGVRYGTVRSLTRPLHGNERVAKFLLAGQAQVPRAVTFEIRDINLAPAIVTHIDGKPLGVMSFEVVGQRIRNIFILADPDKLHSLAEQR
jgi:RNA polymerase sigma-70 factor (ECF subfamily)